MPASAIKTARFAAISKVSLWLAARRVHQGSNVRFGSKADICSAKAHVRFTPNSGHVRCKEGCPLWAISGPLVIRHTDKEVMRYWDEDHPEWVRCFLAAKNGHFRI
jgi:hypothetical protein